MDLFRRQDSRFMETEIKTVKVFRNGDHSKQADITIKPATTFQQLRDEILSKLGLRETGTFKLYTNEGVELYEDCVPLIRNEDRLFASLGEEFDQNTTLAEYKELRVLGEGGFGKVLLMEHGNEGQLYAVKYVDARKYGLASLIDMVFKEAELLKNINHKHIVEIVNFFALKDMRVVFVMEFLKGGELGEYLRKKGKLEEEEAREIFIQLVDAVNFCHLNNIIHRDLKLENILFESTESKNIKVVDFGIAGFYSNLKGSESSAGSLRYMAPEVLTGRNKAANPAIDVWSMGVILHALLHGALPFDGKNKKEVIEKIVYGKHEIAPELRKKISLECQDLLSRMLIVDYKNRITTFEIMDHPWVRGEKNAFAPWYDTDDNSSTLNRNSLGNGRNQLLKTPSNPVGGHHVKSKGSLGGFEKDIFPRISVLNNESKHRKSNSRDASSYKDLLAPQKEKKSWMYEEGKRAEKRLLTTQGFEKEPIPMPLMRVQTEKKINFPTISASTPKGVKAQGNKVGKKSFF